MATITLGNTKLNESLSVLDKVYYAPINAVGGFDKLGAIVEIGTVNAINRDTSVITVTTGLSSVDLTSTANFLLFSKNNAVETSGLTGYYASVKMKNNSTSKAELFSVNSEIVQSSK